MASCHFNQEEVDETLNWTMVKVSSMIRSEPRSVKRRLEEAKAYLEGHIAFIDKLIAMADEAINSWSTYDG